jgi:hypothetical protein
VPAPSTSFETYSRPDGKYEAQTFDALELAKHFEQIARTRVAEHRRSTNATR